MDNRIIYPIISFVLCYFLLVYPTLNTEIPKIITTDYGVEQGSLELSYMGNYTEWVHYAWTTVGVCAFEAFPEDNKTITSVSYRVQKPSGEYVIGTATTWVSGTQVSEDSLIWESPTFKPNAFGTWTCTANATQNDDTSTTKSGTFHIAYYTPSVACAWKQNCTLTSSASISYANFSAYYLKIGSGVTITLQSSSTTIAAQEKFENAGTLSASGASAGADGRQIIIKSRNIYNTGNINIYGYSSVECKYGSGGTGYPAYGGDGGSLLLRETSYFNNTGLINGYGGTGQSASWGNWSDICDTYGGFGGNGGYINTTGLAEFYNTGTINLDAGDAGDGGCNEDDPNDKAGYGGIGGNAGYIQIDAIKQGLGTTYVRGGDGGDGGFCNSPPYYWCGDGGDGGNGSTENKYCAHSDLTATATVSAAKGFAGSAGYGTCSAGSDGSVGSHTIYNSTAITGAGYFTPTPSYSAISSVSSAAPTTPTITAPSASSVHTILFQNITFTWDAVAGVYYELQVDNDGNEVFETERVLNGTVFYPSQTYSGSYEIDTHRYGEDTTTILKVRAYNATNKRFSSWGTRTVSFQNINTSMNGWSEPTGETISTDNIEFWCNYTNSTTNTTVYAANVYAYLDGTPYETTYDPTTGYYYYNSSGELYAGNHTWYCSGSKTDYDSTISTTYEFNISGFKIHTPFSITPFWVCFPDMTNVTPYGQTAAIGAFRIESFNESNNNYSIKVNTTIPTGVTMCVNNVSARASCSELGPDYTPILYNVNSSNSSAYIWMWVDCVGAAVAESGLSIIYAFNSTEG